MSRIGTIARRTFLFGSAAIVGGVAFAGWYVTRPAANPLRVKDREAYILTGFVTLRGRVTAQRCQIQDVATGRGKGGGDGGSSQGQQLPLAQSQIAKGSHEGAKLVALRASRSSLLPPNLLVLLFFPSGGRRESAKLVAIRASRSAKREVRSPWGLAASRCE